MWITNCSFPCTGQCRLVQVMYEVALTTHNMWATTTRCTSATWYKQEIQHSHYGHPTLRRWSILGPMLTWLSIAVPSIWNSLPAQVQQCHSTRAFKWHLKTRVSLSTGHSLLLPVSLHLWTTWHCVWTIQTYNTYCCPYETLLLTDLHNFSAFWQALLCTRNLQTCCGMTRSQ